MGAERLSADASTLRGLRDRPALPKNWRQEDTMNRVAGILTAAALLLAASNVTAQTGAAPRGAATGQRGGAATPAQPGRGTATKPAVPARKSPGAGPVLVVETVKGTFEFETYPNEAPKTVEHVLALVKRNFYNGQRVHRVEPGFVVQFGDPQTRDMTKRDDWGTGGSGKAIGASEVSKKRTHVTGAVAMAHLAGDPRGADSQMYIVLSPQPQLNADYTVFGQVISGLDVVQKLRVTDIIRRVTVKDEAPKK
jgi:peptidyl-prolyl cis-trans isomerase B (cyclophilin B)